MSQALVDLYNQALSAAGTRGLISLPTETSREAEICNLWYATVRNQVLRAAPWSCCRASVRLAVLSERTTDVWAADQPEPPWRFSYGLPIDFLYPRWLATGHPFVLGSFGNVNALNTDAEDAILIYSRRVEDMTRWDADVWQAVVYALAATVVMPLTGKPGRTAQLVDEANRQIIVARVHMANENVQEFESLPDWLLVRGASGTPPARFVYPNGALISASVASGGA